jgi:hypothetical protein
MSKLPLRAIPVSPTSCSSMRSGLATKSDEGAEGVKLGISLLSTTEVGARACSFQQEFLASPRDGDIRGCICTYRADVQHARATNTPQRMTSARLDLSSVAGDPALKDARCYESLHGLRYR